MYELYASKNRPLALWMMDATSPYPDYSGSGVVASTKSGSGAGAKSCAIVAGAGWSTLFSSTKVCEFAISLFQQGMEREEFALEAWVFGGSRNTNANPIQILSHDTFFDGLSIAGNVISFGTQYLTAGSAICSYDIGMQQSVHVVGKHGANSNDLWVNGEHVASVEITDAQKADSFIATNGKLYAGQCASVNPFVALNAVAFYKTLTDSQIKQNYRAGNRTMPQDAVPAMFGGRNFTISTDAGNEFVRKVWSGYNDFNNGYSTNIAVTSAGIVPSEDASGTSLSGQWFSSVGLFTTATSIYGIMLEWTGSGMTVETSLNGTTWNLVTNGRMTPTGGTGLNPNNLDLRIRVTFAGGVVNDPSYLSYLTIHGYVTNTINTSYGRTITVDYPSIVKDNYEPGMMHINNGVRLVGTSVMTVSADTSGDPVSVSTLEAWVKPFTTGTTFSTTGTVYRNAVVDATLPLGEWSLVHIVSATPITSFTITGDVQVGQLVLYPAQLAASDISTIYSGYTGYPVIQFSDSSAISISEPASPVTLYSHAWSIDGVG